jgi:hypothetical protein
MTLTILDGDLVFSSIGEIDNDPISGVTEGYRGARLNHMGVAVNTKQGLCVLEAIYPEVRLTTWESFQRNSAWPQGSDQYRLLVGRLQDEYQFLIDGALTHGLALKATPYDKLYLTDQAALYCSELVVDMFTTAIGGSQFFRERPMSFRDPLTGEVHPGWQAYYDYYGIAVPEGEPGSNPGDISRDGRLDIVEVVGTIPGLVKEGLPLELAPLMEELLESELPEEFDLVGYSSAQSTIATALRGEQLKVISSKAGSSFPVDVALGLVFGFVGAAAGVIAVIPVVFPQKPGGKGEKGKLPTKLMIDLIRAKLNEKQNRTVSDKALAAIIARVREVDEL